MNKTEDEMFQLTAKTNARELSSHFGSVKLVDRGAERPLFFFFHFMTDFFTHYVKKVMKSS
jgi:hypothetical protein